MKKIGIIGLGDRISTIFKNMLQIFGDEIQLTAYMDIAPREALVNRHSALSEEINAATAYTCAEEMLEKEALDAVMIGTRCSMHSHYARLAIKKNITLFLEKPVVTAMDDWRMLRKCYEKHNEKTVVSFPLRFTPIIKKVKEIVDSGALGEIQHVQAFNYVPYGGVYYHDWYRNDTETGGLFLQKATHDFDYINYILGINPVKIAAMGSKQVFKGDKKADLHCVDCDEYKSCPESPFVRIDFDSVHNTDMCCFAVDTGNHDCASALLLYETGMHVGYTQNFFARRHSQKRGAIFSGYKGTVEFDFYTLQINVYPHHIPAKETIQLDAEHRGHFGGDEGLIRDFMAVVNGDKTSSSTLKDGLMSALMCLQARESEANFVFKEINFDEFY